MSSGKKGSISDLQESLDEATVDEPLIETQKSSEAISGSNNSSLDELPVARRTIAPVPWIRRPPHRLCTGIYSPTIIDPRNNYLVDERHEWDCTISSRGGGGSVSTINEPAPHVRGLSGKCIHKAGSFIKLVFLASLRLISK